MGPEDVKKKELLKELFNKALEHVKKAENRMTKQEAIYYRDAVMKQLAKYL